MARPANHFIHFNHEILHTAVTALAQTYTFRCRCGHCQAMPSEEMSVCCQDIPKVWAKVEAYLLEFPAQDCSCITLHPGFRGVCLDRWALEAAYYTFRQVHGALSYSTDE